MRFSLRTTLLAVHMGVLLFACAALLTSARLFLPAGPGSALTTALLPGLGVALLLAVGSSLLIYWRLAPLKKIQHYAQAVSNNDKTAALDVERCGALAPLAGAVRHMAHTHTARSQWYEGILNTLPPAISVTDMDMHWTFCNTAAINAMGKGSLEGILGLHCSEKKGNICNTPQCGIEQLRLGNKKVINHMPNGKTMQITLDYLHDASGTPVGHVEIGEDITEKVRLEQEGNEAAHKARTALVAQLEGVVAALNETAGVLNTSLSGVRAQAGTAAERLSETAVAMNEMNSTVLEVARNAEGASDAATSVRGQAHEGDGLVVQTIKSLHTVRERSASLKGAMQGLDRQAGDIGTVLTLIRDVADQTNLLALNAAIEAARAGEAGRGFAVVADEVRKLAEKTMTATREVESAIAAIQHGSAQSVATVDNAVAAIEEAGQLGEASGRALQQISTLADDSSSRVAAIATAATEQSSASEEINRNVSEVNQLSAAIASAMDDSTATVRELAGQAQVLREILDTVRQGADAAPQGENKS